MASGDITQGRRVPEEDHSKMEAGDYTVLDGVAWVCLPDGTGPCRLFGWDTEEHEDGTITVSPSILDRGPGGWHGYLKQGVWSEI